MSPHAVIFIGAAAVVVAVDLHSPSPPPFAAETATPAPSATAPAARDKRGWAKVGEPGSSMWTWLDPDTGCVYLVYDEARRAGMSPRLRPDGRPDCPATGG